MLGSVPIGARVRCVVHLACTLAVALLLAAPMLLGPATPWAMRALGGEAAHVCACGMKRGTCVCPECADLEHARVATKKSSTRPVLRATCDDDEAPMPSVSPLPRATLPAPLVVLSLFDDRAAPAPACASLSPCPREAPPTPPPERAA